MVRYLTYKEVFEIHDALIRSSGGSPGTRDEGALMSAVAQPEQAMFGNDLYPDIETKAAALSFSLIQNHCFLDGNKRVGHAAMVIFLKMNGFTISATESEQEAVVLAVASHQMSREEWVMWIRQHIVSLF